MSRSYRAFYLIAAVLVLAPVALRAVTWHKTRPQTLEPSMVQAGEVLFKHDWTVNDPLANGGDGLGPVFNATSCVACHNKGGVGGSGGNDHNVTLFTVRMDTTGKPREGVIHARFTEKKFQETLNLVDASFPATSTPTLNQLVPTQSNGGHCLAMPRNVHVSQRNTPALFGAKLIDEIPEHQIIANERSQRLKMGMAPSNVEDLPVGRALRLADGRIGRFGWKAQSASLSDFVQAACANELGLGNPGQAQPVSMAYSSYKSTTLDLTQAQCDQLTAFCASLPQPSQKVPDEVLGREGAAAGKRLFSKVGCADCHTPDIGSVEGIYSDLLIHRMGEQLQGGGSYNEPPLPRPDGSPGDGPSPGEWRTPPLWGVADSAPYLHDGRAATLEEAIKLHGGQGAASATRFQSLNERERNNLVAFLKTLKAPDAR